MLFRSNIPTGRNTAVALGKALFWDMQVGSDGVQACASCHSTKAWQPAKFDHDKSAFPLTGVSLV